MARARNIKPGFFRNADLVELSMEARLLFIGLWTMADREGRLEDRPKQIKMEIFPCDDCNVEDALIALEKSGFLIRYSSGGKKYAQVVNFTKHQMPHHKEVASEIPAPLGFQQITKHTYDVSKEMRESVFLRDNHACLRCGSKDQISLDHITPLASGGDNAMTNLQTLCKSCNSSKGNTTKDHRKPIIDPTLSQHKNNDGAFCPPDSGFLNPDPRILIPDTGYLKPDTGTNTMFEPPPAEAVPATVNLVKVKKPPKAIAPTAETWQAYSDAYRQRYNADPVRNATVNGQLSQLVSRLGAEDAPHVAAWFLNHRHQFYVTTGHSVGILLRDCEKLRTEWVTGRQVTMTQAMQQDKTQTNFSVFDKLRQEAAIERERLNGNR